MGWDRMGGVLTTYHIATIAMRPENVPPVAQGAATLSDY